MGIERHHNQRIQAILNASPSFAGFTIYHASSGKSIVFFTLFHFFVVAPGGRLWRVRSNRMPKNLSILTFSKPLKSSRDGLGHNLIDIRIELV